MPPLRKILLLSGLYFAQGLPFGFQAVALKAYLRQAGVSLEVLGYLSALSLPWVLKALWAPLVDRYYSVRFGRFKSWIVPMQSLLLLTCAAAAFVPPDQTRSLLVLVFFMNLFAATQDIAVDGLAVDLLSESELGPGNSAQVVGYKIGMLCGGGLLVWASQWIGWAGLFGCMAGFIAIVLVGVLLWREPPPSHLRDARGGDSGAGDSGTQTLRGVMALLAGQFRSPTGRWLVAFVLTYKLGEALCDALFTPFLIDAHYTPQQLGLWVGSWGMGFSVAGSLIAGALVWRWPIWRALAVVCCLRALPLAAQWWLTLLDAPQPPEIIVVTCAEHFFGGMLTPCVFAFMMARVDRSIGATHYTLLASLEVLGKGVMSFYSGVIGVALGYSGAFALGVGLSVAFLFVLIPLRPITD
jgi:PAT family beta-lactamase induction signal transducer AmpG